MIAWSGFGLQYSGATGVMKKQLRKIEIGDCLFFDLTDATEAPS